MTKPYRSGAVVVLTDLRGAGSGGTGTMISDTDSVSERLLSRGVGGSGADVVGAVSKSSLIGDVTEGCLEDEPVSSNSIV